MRENSLPLLTVIIVTHNRLEYTRRTIDSLVRTVPDARIFIVDNDSTEDGMQDYLTSLKYDNKQVVGILYHQNVGWGAAVNEAVREITGTLKTVYEQDYFLISNNDVEYYDGWYEKCLAAYGKYPDIGILGVWKHVAHGVLEDRGDLIVKDQMPAVGWLITPDHLREIGAFPEHGPCATKGGNGEDVGYCIQASWKNLLVAGLPEDVASHFDGY